MKSFSLQKYFRIFSLFSSKEIIYLSCLVILALGSSFYLSLNFYQAHTKKIPILGGTLKEGVQGRPRFINPVLATSGPDQDLSQLIFSGLLKYDQQGRLVKDLAKDYQIKDRGRIFKFTLRKAFWHDGEKVTAQDIIFTVNTLKDPQVKSPYAVNWQGVKVRKLNQNKVQFELKEPYPRFLENTTFGILPAHILKSVPKAEIPLADFNFEPVGSGPFKVKKITKDQSGSIQSLTLVANQNYYRDRPYLNRIQFQFFENRENLIKALNSGRIDSAALISAVESESIKNLSLKSHHLRLPRYFGVFFNPDQSQFLDSEKIRKALNYGTDRKQILEKVLSGQGKAVFSPLLGDLLGLKKKSSDFSFDPSRARELLRKAGFPEGKKEIIKGEKIERRLERGSEGREVKVLQKCLAQDSEIYPEAEITGYFGSLTEQAVIRFQKKYQEQILTPLGLKKGTGTVGPKTRKKLNEICLGKKIRQVSLTLVCPDQPMLKQTAQLLKKQWEELGVSVKVKSLPTMELKQNFIKPRNYQALLFGEVLSFYPDLFPFWHSSQIQDPGLNLTKFGTEDSDRLLEQARTKELEAARKDYLKLEQILLDQAPAVFLYNPDFVYMVNRKLKGIEMENIAGPSHRFEDVENWYIKTGRKWSF